MTSRTVFALGLGADNDRAIWFLGRGASLGNMMRTSDPATARTWASVAELELWVDGLPDSAKDQIADRTLTIFALTVSVSEPVGTLTLKTVEPATKEEPAVRAVEKTTKANTTTKTKRAAQEPAMFG
jgi:hypothetical protein